MNKTCADCIHLQAENKRLCAEIDELIIAKDLLFDEAEALIKKAKAEAIKEFAERLKEKWRVAQVGRLFNLHKEIDNLVKEMVGDGDE